MPTQPPSIGRSVHFHDEGGPYAAIITAVHSDGTVDLVTFGSRSIYFQHHVHQAARAGAAGTWDWPTHVPPKP